MMRIPEIGRDIAWIDVIRQVFRVIEFDRAGTTIGSGDTVKATSRFKPYGYLLVESPSFNHRTKLPIVHRDDFVLVSTVFDEPHLADLVTEDELLVTYVPKRKLPTGHALGPSHVLHYVLVPRGTLNEYYNGDKSTSPSAIEQLFVEFVYEGEIRVQVNSEPFPDPQRQHRIHNIVSAWQDSVETEIELNDTLLSTFQNRFSEGYGPSGREICEYADILASAKIENSHSRSESELPSPCEQIKLAILEVTELAVEKEDNDVTFELLKMVYSSLARFLPEPQARLVTSRNIAWLSEEPNHPAFGRSAEAEQVDANVEADESRLADEFDQLVAKAKKQRNQEELERLRNEKAKLIRERARLELEMSKAFLDLNPDDPDAVIGDLLEEFRSSDVREGSAGKYCGDALMAWRKGDRETAFDLFTNAIELDSDDPVTLLNRGNLQLEMGRFEAGIEDLERAREMAPELPCVNADIMKMLDAEEREAWRQRMLERQRHE